MNNRNGTDTADRLDRKLDPLKERVTERVDAIRSRVVDAKNEAITRGNAYLDRATDAIKAHPLKAVGIAFGVGYLGMRLFRR
jgi:ElaB/YqjD/DUF883 family membrane-anchored ribosome-binding protein